MWTNAMAFAFMLLALVSLSEGSLAAPVSLLRLAYQINVVLSCVLISMLIVIAWYERPEHAAIDLLIILLVGEVLDTRRGLDSAPHQPPTLF